MWWSLHYVVCSREAWARPCAEPLCSEEVWLGGVSDEAFSDLWAQAFDWTPILWLFQVHRENSLMPIKIEERRFGMVGWLGMKQLDIKHGLGGCEDFEL